MTHRRNGKPKHLIIHGNQLCHSKIDDIELAAAVEDRFLQLCQLHLGIAGCQLPIPKELNRDMLRWRQMRTRHKQMDFRHTDAEMRSVKAVAVWTINTKFRLLGKKPPVIEWEN